ncbi:energy-coupling factor transporter ATPase [Bacillus suaedae]|uniref:Energy-coupling factor transporter ATP-binding protein EcfA2 n=1 Tax=Halalkalibacter suaedae TaxID=2822140 RepID=A0A940X1T2_9BACI|nr:energy-coupling factor transporter ATPase [Bacillus suaedae]MBP3953439.1 energy-coupling factor transporter ATPase [Bacillus suaedae]
MDIIFNNVSHSYMKGTSLEKKALNQLNISIPSGSFTVVIGKTGSGKSTFIQHVNGLIKPTEGHIKVGQYRLSAKEKRMDMRSLRQDVALLFQYPEHQLFEETVERDICFGPLNFGLSAEEAKVRALESLALVGLPETILGDSPFHLSGGQMRRVAIAGVLASRPKVLLLDEPTASLDPQGSQEIMDMFKEYQRTNGATIILVTHQMEHAVNYADSIIVMNDGEIVLNGDRDQVFGQSAILQSLGLELPDSLRFIKKFANAFSLADVPSYYQRDEVASYIAKYIRSKEG